LTDGRDVLDDAVGLGVVEGEVAADDGGHGLVCWTKVSDCRHELSRCRLN